MPRPTEKKLYRKFPSQTERLLAWQENRAYYDEWRHTPDGESWVRQRRNRQFNKCFICLTDLNEPIHVDHIFPLYLGGTNALTNLCVVHAECNIRKGVRVYMTYKEACKRRHHFNRLRNGLNLRRKMKKNPSAVIGKKKMKDVVYLSKFFSEEQIIDLLKK